MIKGVMGDDADPRETRPQLGRRTNIDRVSKAIIEQLQRDGRRPYADIADSLDLPEEAVVNRVKELTEAGLIQIVAVTDPLQLGFARQAMVGIKVEGPKKPVAEALAAIDDVDYVVITAGDFDILAEVIGKSDSHLLELVSARIRPIPGVTAIHTFLYMELQKQTYTWGVR